MQDGVLKANVSALLAEAGYATEALTFERSDAGGNNRIFFINNAAPDTRLVAKCYFSHPTDRRDRLGAEFAFLSYARQIGLGCVPEPIACDKQNQLGLYECVEGRKLAPQEITQHHVTLAARFFRALNENDIVPAARALPLASEACFSISDHFALIAGRIEQLTVIIPESDVDKAAKRFVERMRGEWPDMVTKIGQNAQRLGIAVDAVLPTEKRCVSPSDFGFHNVLSRSGDGLCFIDFEYAGWDDPAKMAADFFCQPQVPVDRRFLDEFLNVAMSFSTSSDELSARAHTLLPVCQTKWCCIVMNEFLPAAAKRRRFANPRIDELDRKRLQLNKARHMFDTIQL